MRLHAAHLLPAPAPALWMALWAPGPSPENDARGARLPSLGSLIPGCRGAPGRSRDRVPEGARGGARAGLGTGPEAGVGVMGTVVMEAYPTE
jgi:hypothetical protein